VLSVVLVTAELPDERLGGGGLRLAHLIPPLAEAFDLHVIVGGRLDGAPWPTAARLTEVPLPLRRTPHPLARRVRSLRDSLFSRWPDEARVAGRALQAFGQALGAVSQADVVVVEQAGLGLLRTRAPHLQSATWACTIHNVPSARVAQQRAVAPGARERWFLAREETKARALERWIADAYDLVLTVSEEDRDRLGVAGPIIPNGVDTTRFAPSPLPAAPELLFSGSLDYLPNVEGITWFCDEVLPAVRAAVPTVHLAVVGRRPVARVRALDAVDGVTVHADVPAIDPFLHAARVALVPLRIGTGTRLKALEAMASGRPLVGTAAGLEGLGLVDGVSAAIVDEPAAMAAAIVRLLEDDTAATAQAAAARRRAETTYDWRAIGAELVRVLSSPRPA
jgi:glycosyltransferase involved in cell wall biosynthesis